MSTASQIFADNFKDTVSPARRKKKQTPYKPRLATSVKNTLEDSVKATADAQALMQRILALSETQRTLTNDLRADINQLAPLDHRMQRLLRRNGDLLDRNGEIDNLIGQLALKMGEMERELTATLNTSRPAAAPAKERTTPNGSHL